MVTPGLAAWKLSMSFLRTRSRPLLPSGLRKVHIRMVCAAAEPAPRDSDSATATIAAKALPRLPRRNIVPPLPVLSLVHPERGRNRLDRAADRRRIGAMA